MFVDWAELSADYVRRAGTASNSNHATPDAGATRPEGIGRQALNISMRGGEEVSKCHRFLISTCENAIGNDRGEDASGSQELVRVQHMRNVLAPFKWRVQNNGIKSGLKDHWVQVEEVAANKVNHCRFFVFRS